MQPAALPQRDAAAGDSCGPAAAVMAAVLLVRSLVGVAGVLMSVAGVLVGLLGMLLGGGVIP